jgi:hypothetical protein
MTAPRLLPQPDMPAVANICPTPRATLGAAVPPRACACQFSMRKDCPFCTPPAALLRWASMIRRRHEVQQPATLMRWKIIYAKIFTMGAACRHGYFSLPPFDSLRFRRH